MNFTKRQFVNRAAALSIGVALLTTTCDGIMGGAYAFNQSPQIPLFGTALRGAGPGGIPVALPGPLPAPVTGVTHYQIGIIQYQDQITPTGIGLGPTTLWGYVPLKGLGGFIGPKHLGGIIIGKGRNPNDKNDKNVPIQVTFHNELFVNKHIVPVDTTIPGANQAINRTAIHLHGGLIPWISDGGPFDWFGPIGDHGGSFLNNQVLNPVHLPGAAEYYYPMNQSARFMWYHDHAWGITRVNAYAGLASAMLVRDGFEASLIPKGLPNYVEAGGREIPLVFQDKIFVGPDIKTKDSKWSSMVQPAATKSGSLWYAHTYEINKPDGSGRWDLEPGATPSPDPSVVPEFFGDTMLVNGTTFPKASVEPRRYRLRMLNACNARFLNLQLYIADPDSLNGIKLDVDPASKTYGKPLNDAFINKATGKASWLQIGTEGGFLSKPMEVPSNVPFVINDKAFLGITNNPPSPSLNPALVDKSLLVAPAERPDLIVDFSDLKTGTSVILYNDAAAPFPLGDDRNDYFPKFPGPSYSGSGPVDGSFGLSNPVNMGTNNGFGPNTRVLMRFDITDAKSPKDNPLTLSAAKLEDGIDKAILPWNDIAASNPFAHISNIPTRRFLTLNEASDEYGRLIQLIGDAEQQYGSPLESSSTYLNYGIPAQPGPVGIPSTSQRVYEGDTEIWEIYNTTGDVHPMHFHLVNVQVINRELVNTQVPEFPLSGTIIPPEANELGWKETVPMYPGTVTRVIMKWDTAGATIVDKNLKLVNTKGIGKIQLPIKNGQPPLSPRTKSGFEYVWHCHILEHEEHDMMHTINVIPKVIPPLQ